MPMVYDFMLSNSNTWFLVSGPTMVSSGGRGCRLSGRSAKRGCSMMLPSLMNVSGGVSRVGARKYCNMF